MPLPGGQAPTAYGGGSPATGHEGLLAKDAGQGIPTKATAGLAVLTYAFGNLNRREHGNDSAHRRCPSGWLRSWTNQRSRGIQQD